MSLPCDRAPESDYDFWCVAFHNESGEELYREDAEPPEISRMKLATENCYRVERAFNSRIKPAELVIWPHSTSKGWCERIALPI